MTTGDTNEAATSETGKAKPSRASANGSAMAPTEDRLPTDSLRLVLQLEDTEANRFIMEQAHETLKRQVIPEANRRAILKLEQIRLTSVLLPKSPNGGAMRPPARKD